MKLITYENFCLQDKLLMKLLPIHEVAFSCLEKNNGTYLQFRFNTGFMEKFNLLKLNL